jgi:(2Fe-2S) ferredoxin
VRECCKRKNSLELRNYFKKRVTELKLEKKIRINQSGCLDKCELGPIMVIYPEGVWYSFKNLQDIEEIIKSHLTNGIVVKRLLVNA